MALIDNFARGLAQNALNKINNSISPVITKVYTEIENKPTANGYYIFTTFPLDLFPDGCTYNDICYLNNGVWTKYKSFADAPPTILAGNTTDGFFTWKKQDTGWIDPFARYSFGAHETEYTYNRKTGYRIDFSGTTQGTAGTQHMGNIPGGMIILNTMVMINPGDGFCPWTKIRATSGGWFNIILDTGDTAFMGKPYKAHIEYAIS